jgi:hypothetical protein
MSPPIPLPDFPGSDNVESILNILTADVDLDFFVSFRREAGGRLRFLVTGQHDGFPAYELYVNKLLAYFWDPVVEGTDNRDMQDILQEEVEMNAPLLVPRQP